MSQNAHISTLSNGTLGTQIFLSVAVLVAAWFIFFQDYTPLQSVRLQSPITFIEAEVAAAAAAAAPPSHSGEGTGEGANTAAQFDLSAIARAEKIELKPDDHSLDAQRQAYIRKYAPTAIAEQKKYGIPASITIAQGLLETRAGQSKLATQNNNHFGMKCFSKKCGKGHCSNHTDDTHKDFFVKYKSAWESYRAHSKLLRSGCYAHIEGDYVQWAHGLKKCGYATAPDYAQSLIRLIRLYGLDRLDKM